MEDGVYIADGKTWIFFEGTCFVPHDETLTGLYEYPQDLGQLFIKKAKRLVHFPITGCCTLRRKKS